MTDRRIGLAPTIGAFRPVEVLPDPWIEAAEQALSLAQPHQPSSVR